MTTNTDTQFSRRFTGLQPTTFIANQSTLEEYQRTESPLNEGLMSDIGRATIYGPDVQPSFFRRFMRAELPRGNAALAAASKEINSRAYNPQAPDTDLFNGNQVGFYTDVAKKNFSRQAVVEVNSRMLKQYAQTGEMVGDVEAAIMAASNVCYLDDMWVAAKEFFSASTRAAKTGQLHTMTASIGDANNAFGLELNELLWDISQKQFGFKTGLYNPAGRNTRTQSCSIVLKKDCEYPWLKKLLSETFNPETLKVAVNGGVDYVDDFATPAGAPSDAGELIGMVVDDRAWDIVPMPEALTVESFRNPARLSTAYFTTYEYAFQAKPFFNVAYIFAPKGGN